MRSRLNHTQTQLVVLKIDVARTNVFDLALRPFILINTCQVKVWGIKWALGSTGTGLDEEKPELKANPLYDDAGNAIYDNPFDDRDHGMDAGELDKTATSTSIPASNANTATTGESGRGVVQTTSDHDRTVHDSVTTDDISSVAEESLMDGTVTPPAENIRHTKAGTKDRKENGSTGEGSGDIDGSTAHSGNPAAGSDGGKWESTAASPWEPDSIDGEHCGDRYAHLYSLMMMSLSTRRRRGPCEQLCFLLRGQSMFSVFKLPTESPSLC